jgi:gamma-glutamyltranspeptidase/glutathione hydrolase
MRRGGGVVDHAARRHLDVNASSALSSLTALTAIGLVLATFPVGCGEPPPVASPENHRPSASSSASNAAATQSAAPAKPPQTSQPAVAPAPKSHRYAVSTENPTATRIAMSVLERGGSAADAAIAAVLALGVAQPVSSGVGGGGFAVVWDAKQKRVTVLDFRETAPRGLKPEDHLKRPIPDGKEAIMTGVPGEVAGLAEIHARWGKLAFAEVVRGPMEAAARGFPVSSHMARVLKMNEKWVLKTPSFPGFHAAGALRGVGDRVTNPALAATLQRIGAEGKAAFYKGAIAKDILETARAAGSRMAQDDLDRYEVIERAPLRTEWEGYEVYTMPPPSAGGVMLLETLHMHSKADLTALGFGTGAYIHMLAETFRGALADRIHKIGDPAFIKADVDAMVNRERMKARKARISLTATTPAEKFPVTEAGTSHFVVVDEEGNVVSITSTVNNMFGAKVVTKGGFLLNDELADFTPEPLERRFGIRRGPNYPRGGARPTSSMTPTIVFRGNTPVFSLGGSGGWRIATATTQVFLAHLAFDRPVTQAVADPRLETPPWGGLSVETTTAPELIKDLESRGEVVNSTTANFSAVQAVSIRTKDGARVIEAGADPRKGGEGAVQ